MRTALACQQTAPQRRQQSFLDAFSTYRSDNLPHQQACIGRTPLVAAGLPQKLTGLVKPQRLHNRFDDRVDERR